MRYPFVASQGGEPLPGPPEAFGKMIAAETEKREKVVKAAGLKVE